MNKTNLFLLIALVVQAILIVLVALPRGSASSTEATALLPDFDPSAVTRIVITNPNGAQIQLAKLDDGTWGLADVENYPVQDTRVNDLLTRLAGMNTARLISDNVANQRRLRVADEEFERKVEIAQGDQTYTLYLGTSSGVNATHTRLAGSERVYLSANVDSTSVSTEISTWVQTSYITVDSATVVSMTIENENGTFIFDRVDDLWLMRDLEAGEQFDESAVTTLLARATALTLRKPLGKVAQDDYGIDTPSAKVTFTVRQAFATDDEGGASQTLDTTYELVIGAVYEDGYVAKSNKSDFYVQISTFNANEFTNKTRDDFIISQES